MRLDWRQGVYILGLSGFVAGLAIRADAQNEDIQASDEGISSTSSLNVNQEDPLQFSNGSAALGEDMPRDFVIEPRVKQGGKILLKYDCYQALVECAAATGAELWTQSLPAVVCDSVPAITIKFTSNRAPRPGFEARSILWSLYHLFQWWAHQVTIGEPKWYELSFFSLLDTQTRLGIGTVSATGGSTAQVMSDPGSNSSSLNMRTTSIEPAADMADPNIFNGSNFVWAPDSAVTVPVVMEPFLKEEYVNVGIGWIQDGKLVCGDLSYYRTVMEMILMVAEGDAQSPIGQGRQLYNHNDDYTFAVHATSQAAGVEGVLKHWQVLRALTILASMMRNADPSDQFHEYLANIVTGAHQSRTRGTRVVGKMILKKGKHFTAGLDSLDGLLTPNITLPTIDSVVVGPGTFVA